jgi:hypothetical protein
MDLSAVGLEEGWSMELAHYPQDRVQWRSLVSAVSNLRVLLPASYFIRTMRLREPGCEAKRMRCFFKTIRIMKYDLTEERLTCWSQHLKLLGLFKFCTFMLGHYQSYW